jgi:predicted RNase H-like HicB family nuclease
VSPWLKKYGRYSLQSLRDQRKYENQIIYTFKKMEGLNMKLKVVFEPSDEGGYTVYVPSLPGCISEGDNKEDALANIKEAIELYIESVEDDFILYPDTEITEISV